MRTKQIAIGLGGALIAAVMCGLGLQLLVLGIVLMVGPLVWLRTWLQREKRRLSERDQRMASTLRMAIERGVVTGERLTAR